MSRASFELPADGRVSAILVEVEAERDIERRETTLPASARRVVLFLIVVLAYSYLATLKALIQHQCD